MKYIDYIDYMWELSWHAPPPPPLSTDFYHFYFFVNINTVIPPCRTKTLNDVVAMVQHGEERERRSIRQKERREAK